MLKNIVSVYYFDLVSKPLFLRVNFYGGRWEGLKLCFRYTADGIRIRKRQLLEERKPKVKKEEKIQENKYFFILRFEIEAFLYLGSIQNG